MDECAKDLHPLDRKKFTNGAAQLYEKLALRMFDNNSVEKNIDYMRKEVKKFMEDAKSEILPDPTPKISSPKSSTLGLNTQIGKK